MYSTFFLSINRNCLHLASSSYRPILTRLLINLWLPHVTRPLSLALFRDDIIVLSLHLFIVISYYYTYFVSTLRMAIFILHVQLNIITTNEVIRVVQLLLLLLSLNKRNIGMSERGGQIVRQNATSTTAPVCACAHLRRKDHQFNWTGVVKIIPAIKFYIILSLFLFSAPHFVPFSHLLERHLTRNRQLKIAR